MTDVLVVRDLGRMRYLDALEAQRAAHRRVLDARGAAGGESPRHAGAEVGELLLVEHDPPVITLGRRREAASHVVAPSARLAELGVEVVESDRGGDVTWHGPGQLVAYPILDLDRLRLRIHPYMRLLELSVIDAIGAFGVVGHRDPEATGVWVAGDGPARKICAMGVRVSRWVSMHGLALNVENDLSHFGLIVPCGLHGRPVTSLRAELGAAAPPMAAVRTALVESIGRALRAAISLPRG